MRLYLFICIFLCVFNSSFASIPAEYSFDPDTGFQYIIIEDHWYIIEFLVHYEKCPCQWWLYDY